MWMGKHLDDLNLYFTFAAIKILSVIWISARQFVSLKSHGYKYWCYISMTIASSDQINPSYRFEVEVALLSLMPSFKLYTKRGDQGVSSTFSFSTQLIYRSRYIFKSVKTPPNTSKLEESQVNHFTVASPNSKSNKQTLSNS